MERKKRSEISLIQDKIWELCKKIVRFRDGSKCYTCDATGLSGTNWHTGHLIPDSVSGAYLRYDLRNLRSQCYRCNINLGGNGAEFYRRVVIQMGQEWVDTLFVDKQCSIKAIDHYRMVYEVYKRIAEQIPNVDRKLLYSPCETLIESFPQDSACE